ncbi:MAG: hypothetical protein LBL65_02000 [Campylobacteraceae bacterium]|jgi:hypothetical protein|nr:hypothetical protein [Campylobacteraceae bacterium]
MRKTFKILTILSWFLLGLYTNANAVYLTCSKLYIGGANSRDAKSNYADASLSTTTNTFVGTSFGLTSVSKNPTLAIGPYKGKRTLFWWDESMKSTNSVYYIENNDASSRFIPSNSISLDYAASGGAVNQKTGEIYFLSEPGAAQQHITIIQPDEKGTFSLKKKSGSLNFTRNYSKYAFASDMIVDADGSVYLLVNAINNTTSNNRDMGYQLLKIDPTNWSYDYIKLQNNIFLDDNYARGMAFLNGKLYVATSSTGAPVIHVIDPMKGGKGITKGTVKMSDNNNKDYENGIDDMASCQAPAVITGKIYLDKNGDGKMDDSDKTNGKYQFIPNISVEIYDSTTGSPIASQNTGSLGEYSFLVTLGKTYYIRIKQPQINGVNTHQTWANGGEFSWQSTIGIGTNGVNTVTPTCYNKDAIVYDKVDYLSWYSGSETRKPYSRTCYGVRENGIDSSSSKIDAAANYYTKVSINTDLSAAHADFALAPVDRSDAPSSFGEVSHSVLQNGVKMGNLVDVDTRSLVSSIADGDDKDSQNDEDGVEIRAEDGDDNIWSNIKDFDFSNGRYTFRVKVNKKGFLNAWVNINSSAVSTNFVSGTKIADNIEYNDDTGYIVFSADINSKIAVDGGYIDGIKVSKPQNAFFRFRYTSYNASAYKTSITPVNPVQYSTAANSQPWVIDGEVEDYKANYRYFEEPGEVKGAFIIVNKNFNPAQNANKKPNSSDPVFALYTQIVNKPFEAKMVYYDENKSSVGSSFEYSNVNVSVALVDFNGNCDTSLIVQDNVYSAILEQNEVVKTLSGIKIDKAVKNGAFKITYGYIGSESLKTTCSPDVFAVRPKSFILDGSFNGKLIGGSNNSGDLKAVDDGSVKNAQRYNQLGTNIISNATLITPPSCTLDLNVSNELDMAVDSFTNGKANVNINYQNIGKVDVFITDKKWTSADSAKANTDCIVNSSTNTHNSQGLLGCDIAMDKEMSFIPNELTAEMVLGNANNGNFTYLSNDGSMSAHIDTTVKATLHGGAAATNYQKDCFADNVTYNVEFTNDDPLGWDKRSDDFKKRVRFFPNGVTVIDNNGAQNGSGEFRIEQSRFANGVADKVRLNFNFGRNASMAENPFRVALADFNVSELKDSDINGSAVISGDNITLFYGRVFINNYEGLSPIPAEVQYELFCQSCTRDDFDITLSGMNIKDIGWFLNYKHDDSYGKILYYSPRGKTSVTNIGTASNGVGHIVLESDSAPYQDTVYAVPHSWLVNDPTNEAASDVSFTVKFLSNGGGWAGMGRVNQNESDKDAKIGKVVDVLSNKREMKKIEW